MSVQLVLEVSAEIGNLGPLLDKLDAFGERHSWSAEAMYHVRLVVEEMLINVIDYGGVPGLPLPWVKLDLQQSACLLQIKLSDDGVAFNPLAQPTPDLSLSLEDRPIGGLGVHFLRTFMESVHYQRDGSWNHLSFSKQVC